MKEEQKEQPELMSKGATKIVSGRVMAKLSWLRLWPKNPKIAEQKDLDRLKKQITELGVYKPLLITPDGEILGGSQRFKCLTDLAKKNKKYEWVWVSIVNAWFDEQRIKYALSDNEQIGKYTREKLTEVLKPFLEQPTLFKNYNVELSSPETIKNFVDDLAMTEAEMSLRNLEERLTEAGIDKDIIEDVKSMSKFNESQELNPDNLEGCGVAKYKDKKLFIIKLFFLEADEKQFDKLKTKFDSLKGNVIEKSKTFTKEYIDL